MGHLPGAEPTGNTAVVRAGTQPETRLENDWKMKNEVRPDRL